jgi:hypothetical protein
MRWSDNTVAARRFQNGEEDSSDSPTEPESDDDEAHGLWEQWQEMRDRYRQQKAHMIQGGEYARLQKVWEQWQEKKEWYQEQKDHMNQDWEDAHGQHQGEAIEQPRKGNDL